MGRPLHELAEVETPEQVTVGLPLAGVGSRAYAYLLDLVWQSLIILIALIVAFTALALGSFGQILPASVLSIPPRGCLNLHASLLPRYRGAAPINRAIINGDTSTGMTTMLMNEGLDTGDILLQQEEPINDDDDALSLGSRLAVKGASLLLETISRLEPNRLHPQASPMHFSSSTTATCVCSCPALLFA